MKAKLFLLFFGLLGMVVQAAAKEKIYVNSEVTTHIVMPENIKLVDISTTKIMGNQCADNMVRIKPYLEPDSIKTSFDENELLGTITLIGERHIAQYDVVYTHYPSMAASIFEVAYSDTQSYINPEVSMPKAEMVRYAWAVYGSKRKYNQVVSNAHGMKAIVNNIYTIGDYFFIDYSLQNKTKIAYDIEELRVKLTDMLSLLLHLPLKPTRYEENFNDHLLCVCRSFSIRTGQETHAECRFPVPEYLECDDWLRVSVELWQCRGNLW